MPPAFNLSQDQTLQFNACYCFLFFRIGRSLNVLTSSSHLSPKEKTLKTYLNTSVRLDTFASRQRLRRNTATLLSKTPSAHTYRLLVFKEHSPKPPNLNPSRSAAFASLQSQHRNEIMSCVSRFVNRFFTQPRLSDSLRRPSCLASRHPLSRHALPTFSLPFASSRSEGTEF